MFARVLVVVVLCGLCVASELPHVCIHGQREEKLTLGVKLSGDSDHPVKRQTTNPRPIRFRPYFDNSVTSFPDSSKRELIQEVVPAVLDFFSNVVSVPPTPSPILLDRYCTQAGFYQPEGGSTVRRCVDQCITTVCGPVTIPDDHLKRCVQCDNTPQQSPTCSPGDPPTDGAGVADVDYILYISAFSCTKGTTLAFAAACQTESQLNRPISGYINFCPNNLGETTRDYLFQVTKHELFHALAFSYSLMALWRDSDGNRRTPSDEPVSPNTVTTLDYTNWDTVTGPRDHTVTVLRTEAVLREGRTHFNCSDLEGVELENQGGNGTALQHWEKRVLGNEAMTGVFDFNPVFSRLSLAVLEDSGWYSVDYSAAGSLLWGSGRGCDFVRRGCGNMLDEKPYCGMDIGDRTFGCTLDRGSVGLCNVARLDGDVPADFRYLPDNMGGSSLLLADYCPYFREFTQGDRTGNCTNSMNQPDVSSSGGEDVFGETYGEDSVCLEQGRAWQRITDNGGGSRSTLSVRMYGGGCYETQCSVDDGVTVYVRGARFQCECEGQELVVDVTVCQNTYQGSIICPSCSSACDPNLCPPTAPPSCPGSVRQLPAVTVPTDCTTAGCTGPPALPTLSILLLGLVGVFMK